jgi:flagellar hook-associated protein 2
MPSVNSIVGQANMVAGLSTKLFGTNFAAANNSLLIQPANSSFRNFLKSEFGGQPALTNLVENYSNNRESFQETFRENIESLKESSDKLKVTSENTTETPKIADTDNDNNTGAALSTLGEFANGNIPPQERNIALAVKPKIAPKPEPPEKQNLQKFANEYLTAEKSAEKNAASNEDSRVTNVKNLVRDFNSTMSYLNENRGMSNKMSALADNFGNSKLTDSLSEIGISVNSQGLLSLNENTFSSALNNNFEGVNSILGSNGLAGQLDKNINLANYQSDKLFTSITDYANNQRQDDAESLYGNNANYAKENSPRIFAMFT